MIIKKVSNPILDKPKINLQKNIGKSNITSRYYIKAVGVTFSKRQQIISRLKPGDKLKFVPEPNNSYDRFAIQIINLNGEQIGYVSKDYNQGIFKKIQAGQKYNLLVESITGGGYNSIYGVNILVEEIR